MWSPLLGLIILVAYITALARTVVDTWNSIKEERDDG